MPARCSITPSRALADARRAAVEQQMPADGPARDVARARTAASSSPPRLREAMELANSAAPEHLVVDDERLAKQVRSAGSVFVGPWSAQVAGDYAIGSNHVLPTAGAARVRGGLSAADFVRQITVQRLTQKGLRSIGRKRRSPWRAPKGCEGTRGPSKSAARAAGSG